MLEYKALRGSLVACPKQQHLEASAVAAVAADTLRTCDKAYRYIPAYPQTLAAKEAHSLFGTVNASAQQLFGNVLFM